MVKKQNKHFHGGSSHNSTMELSTATCSSEQAPLKKGHLDTQKKAIPCGTPKIAKLVQIATITN